MLQALDHVAIICSDYQRSKKFYVDVLGLKILSEHFRAPRNSWKLDLMLNEHYVIELFSFSNPPARVSRPEALGLRHLAFSVNDLDAAVKHLHTCHVATEPIRVDEYTGKRFTFFEDPDHLPLELYER